MNQDQGQSEMFDLLADTVHDLNSVIKTASEALNSIQIWGNPWEKEIAQNALKTMSDKLKQIEAKQVELIQRQRTGKIKKTEREHAQELEALIRSLRED